MSAIHRIDDHESNHRVAHNLYGLHMAEAGDKALRKRKPESRPFILSRSGWAGLQKYAWTWTGDTGSDWEALRQTIPTVLGLGLSGIPFCGSDIGGFAGDPSPELFVRWMQLSTFLPFFRTHSSKYAPEREPWRFGEPYLGIIRDYLKLRYRLMPYIYSLAWEASQTGRPLVRPLFWIDTNDANLWGVDDAFLLGDSLLVAPILEKGSRSRLLYVPRGSWRDYLSGQLIEGPGSIELKATLEQIPVLIRAGGMIPESEGSTLRLCLSPTQSCRFETVIFSDNGDGYGRTRLDRFIVTCEGYSTQLRRTSEGRFEFPYENIRVSVLGHKIERANVDGVELSGGVIDMDIKLFNTLDLLLSPH
jgi:alpha-glucosidase